MIGAAHLGIIAGATPRASGGAGHRYWRLYFPNPAPAFVHYVILAEVEMRAVVDGPNLCSGGVASASHFSGDAYLAFDGDVGTAWSASSGTGTTDKWIAYDFGVNKEVVQVKITDYTTNFHQSFKIQYSDDGSTWTDATPMMAVGRPASGGSQTYLIGGIKTYWRVYVTANQASNYTNLSELEFRESVGGADATSPGQRGMVDTARSGRVELYAVDNDNATYWESQSGAPPHWIWFAFGRDLELAELSMRTGPYPAESPADFKIQYSGDGFNWTDAKTVSGETGWTAGETRNFTI